MSHNKMSLFLEQMNNWVKHIMQAVSIQDYAFIILIAIFIDFSKVQL